MQLKKREPDHPEGRRDYVLAGLAGAGVAAFAAEDGGDPMAAFSPVSIKGRPLNLWLTDEVLQPVLARWSGARRDPLTLAREVAGDVDSGIRRARLAFQEALQPAARLGEPAILAALGVTANLQRTLGLLGEFMLGDPPGRRTMGSPGPSARPAAGGGGRPRKQDGPVPPPATFRLFRAWCGLLDYPENTAYFHGPVERPTAPGRLRACRSDPGHLRNALRCSPREIELRCGEALETLRKQIQRAGVFGPADLRHLLAPSFPVPQAVDGPAPPSGQEKRSGVVRPRNSSM